MIRVQFYDQVGHQIWIKEVLDIPDFYCSPTPRGEGERRGVAMAVIPPTLNIGLTLVLPPPPIIIIIIQDSCITRVSS